MDRDLPMAPWRAASFAAALFAITFNFLQPLAHAALMRQGMPSAPLAVFCFAAAAEPADQAGHPPVRAGELHECCLGLAHAHALIEPPRIFLPVSHVPVVAPPLSATERPLTVGIRDGPHRPRGPPSLD